MDVVAWENISLQYFHPYTPMIWTSTLFFGLFALCWCCGNWLSFSGKSSSLPHFLSFSCILPTVILKPPSFLHPSCPLSSSSIFRVILWLMIIIVALQGNPSRLREILSYHVATPTLQANDVNNNHIATTRTEHPLRINIYSRVNITSRIDVP